MVPCLCYALLLEYLAGVLFWGSIWKIIQIRVFRDELFELYIQRAYYMMEHKETSPEVEGEIKKLTKQYKVNYLKEKRRDNNDKH